MGPERRSSDLFLRCPTTSGHTCPIPAGQTRHSLPAYPYTLSSLPPFGSPACSPFQACPLMPWAERPWCVGRACPGPRQSEVAVAVAVTEATGALQVPALPGSTLPSRGHGQRWGRTWEAGPRQCPPGQFGLLQCLCHDSRHCDLLAPVPPPLPALLSPGENPF